MSLRKKHLTEKKCNFAGINPELFRAFWAYLKIWSVD